jgi:hypothetical protein
MSLNVCSEIDLVLHKKYTVDCCHVCFKLKPDYPPLMWFCVSYMVTLLFLMSPKSSEHIGISFYFDVISLL